MGCKMLYALIVALIATQTCTGENTTNANGQTSDGSTTKREKSPLEKGMEPVFEMCHNFLDLAIPYNFYSKSDTPFSAQELTEVIKENDYETLRSRWQDLVKTFGGFAGCIIVGLIFIVFMPIIGMIYCCCHCCCHNCGGTREKMDPKRAVCKRWILTILLLICTTFMLAGAVIVFLGSDLLHQSLRNDDNNGLVGRMDEGLNDFQMFVNDSLKSIDEKVTDTVIKNGVDEILPLIEDAANRTVKRIKDEINATELLREADDLGKAAVSIGDSLGQLAVLLTNLKGLQDNVSSVLNEVNRSVTTCSGCPQIDVGGLSFAPNFKHLDDLSEQANNVDQAQEIQRFVTEASDSFNNISSEIDSTVQGEIDGARDEIKKVNESIYNQVTKLKDKAEPFNKEIKEVHDSINDDVDENLKTAAEYTWYGCIGLGCAVLLVVFFYYMGILYGLCGERPGHRAACCNRETGAGLLCTGICCSFLFAWLLMLVVILLFTLGGLSYSLTCKYTNDGVENIGDLEILLNDGLGVNLSSTLDFPGESNLTVAGMLSDCKKNKGIYTALHLKNLFDIDKEFNLSTVLTKVNEIRDQIDSVNNIGNIELLSSDLQTELENFKSGSIEQVNFTEYEVELNKPLLPGTDLAKLITELQTASNAVEPADAVTAKSLNDSAKQLEILRDTTIPAIERDRENLTSTVKKLKDKANVSSKIDDLIANINKSEREFNAKKDEITHAELNNTVDDIKDLVVSIVDKSKDVIKHDIGKCRSLYDGVQIAMDSVCIITLDPLNAVWFGLGWSLFFYIPSFIFAALLSSLYKRSEKYRQKSRDFDEPIRSHHNGEYDNGYRGGRHDDNVPLTSMGKDERTSSNGAYNYGYQGRDTEHNTRYHRDNYPNNLPEHQSYDRGAPRGGRVYAEPYMDPHDRPPMYDDAVSSPQYDRVGHGGYSSGRRY